MKIEWAEIHNEWEHINNYLAAYNDTFKTLMNYTAIQHELDKLGESNNYLKSKEDLEACAEIGFKILRSVEDREPAELLQFPKEQ